MSEGKRSRLSLTQRSEIWSRWKAGQSLHEIGRAFGKPHSCIRCLLLPRGGIAPALRRRSRLALSRAEREDISRGIASGSSIREIARHLDRAASTVSREVTRHGGRPAYRAHEADDQAWESALRPKKCLLALRPRLQEVVASKLILDWSPEQISGWLKTQYPDDESLRVSHETIYRCRKDRALSPHRSYAYSMCARYLMKWEQRMSSRLKPCVLTTNSCTWSQARWSVSYPGRRGILSNPSLR